MIKSREEKIKDGWKQYFKNIEKENELIRLLIGYYCKIRPQLQKLVAKPKDKKDRDTKFRYKGDYLEDKKSEKMINNWIKEKQRNTYIRINEDWRDCEFEYPGWIK